MDREVLEQEKRAIVDRDTGPAFSGVEQGKL